MLPLLLSPGGRAWAAFGEDMEKPRPEFSQEEGDWIARLIPRGKSTSVQIRFQAVGGALESVAEQAFAEGSEPDLDKKDFRSGFFAAQIAVAPGAEAKLAVQSSYFTTSTELWRGNPQDPLSWVNAAADRTRLPERVQRLTISLRDGGPLDGDGQADGVILAVVAPRDSFWGYAIGTLFIRFFGVFLVLGVLQLGMLISGGVFRRIQARPLQPAVEPHAPAAPALETASAPGVAAEAAAAIALALHLESAAARAAVAPVPAEPGKAASAWAVFGRGRLMAGRISAFDRIQKTPTARMQGTNRGA
jgi:hypothetical protein